MGCNVLVLDVESALQLNDVRVAAERLKILEFAILIFFLLQSLLYGHFLARLLYSRLNEMLKVAHSTR